MNKKIYILIIGIVIAGILFFGFTRFSGASYAALDNFEGEVTFYKSLSCGCCGLHANYMDKILNVNKITVDDVETIKDEYNIPNELRTCHTAVIGGYFVEGHIPLEAINKLMEEKPDIAGIALPGMPSGSPGMPGTKDSEWIIYSVNKDGTSQEFMRL